MYFSYQKNCYEKKTFFHNFPCKIKIFVSVSAVIDSTNIKKKYSSLEVVYEFVTFWNEINRIIEETHALTFQKVISFPQPIYLMRGEKYILPTPRGTPSFSLEKLILVYSWYSLLANKRVKNSCEDKKVQDLISLDIALFPLFHCEEKLDPA